MAQVTLWGATYNGVPAVDLPSGNGTARFYDAVDGDELEYGTEALTDLTGTTWYFNATPDLSDETIYYINFTSNNRTFNAIELYDHTEIDYYGEDDFIAYTHGNWSSSGAYRTIAITGGTDATNATLIAWLEANATRTV